MPTPLDLYKAKVAAGHFDSDPLQERAASALDRLHNAIVMHYGEKTGWIKRMAIFKGKEEAPRGVYMYGPVGRGKSMLMDLFYESIPFGIKKRRVHFHQFMIEVHDYIHSRRSEDGAMREDMDSALPSLASVIANRSKVLCFDEFHVTDVADAMILGRLFTAIFDHGVSVVITSNWEPDRLYEGGLQRDRFLNFIELIKKRMDTICLDGEVDYRARKLREMSVYFTPLGSASSARADGLFSSLTDEEEPYGDLVTVKGRTIEVPVAAKGVARFSFSQLCERPLGAEDYLAIAKRYHTIFLEHVPRLTYDRRNEAKRFMTLVDVLYDQHRNLVITADENPQDLYSGADHAFEFQRTISRLMEMQTPGYLNHKL
jgi:cell division protein ZapE